MTVKLTILMTAALKGKEAFTEASGGLAGVGKAAVVAGAALAAVAAVALGVFFVDTTQKAAEFSDTMMAVKAATGATEEEFEALEDEAKRIGKEFGRFTATEAAEGMRKLAFAGFTVEETLEAIEPVMRLSQAGLIGLEEASRGVASALRSFGMDAGDTNHVVDVMTKTFISSQVEMGELVEAIKYVAPVAHEAGISFEELNAAIGILGDAGLRGSIAGTALRNVIIRLQAPSSEAASMMAALNIEIYELPSAALNAQTAIQRETTSLNMLEQSLEDVSNATRELQLELNKLNIEEAKNNLEIMKIRDKAADESRELTDEELLRIEEIESANRDLSIQQSELSIQQDEYNLSQEQLKISIEDSNKVIEEQTEIFNSSKGQMKSLAGIVEEFTSKMVGLSEAQEAEFLATVFGVRGISAFQILMNSMSGEVSAGSKSLVEFTEALENSAGTAVEVSNIMESGLGNQIKQVESAFESFQLELAEQFLPMLQSVMMHMKNEFIPTLDGFIIPLSDLANVVLTLVSSLMPLIESIIKVVTKSKLLDTIIGIVSDILMSLLPIIESILGIVDLIVPVIGMLFDIISIIIPVISELGPVIDEVVEIVRILMFYIQMLLSPITDIISILVSFLIPVFDMVAKVVGIVGQALILIEPLFLAVYMVIQSLTPLINELLLVLEQLLDPILMIVQAMVDSFIPVVELVATLIIALIPLFDALIQVVIALLPVIVALIPILVALIPLFELQVIAMEPWLQILIALTPLIVLLAEAIIFIIPAIELLALLITAMLIALEFLITPVVNFILVAAQFETQLKALEIIGRIIVAVIMLLWDLFVTNPLNNMIENFKSFLTVLGDIYNMIKDVISAVDELSGGTIGAVVGAVTGGELPSFDEGGIVPGPIGSPQLVVAHGGEEITPPGSSEKSVTLNSNDSFTFNMTVGEGVSDGQARRIGNIIAKEIIREKRQGIGQLLAEED